MNSSVKIDRIEMMPSWSETLRSMDVCLQNVVGSCFECIGNEFEERISRYVREENRLTKYDEKIFEYYKHLMWHYYQTIHMYQLAKNRIFDKHVKEILDGICTVLGSQLKQFEESQEYEYSEDTARNPIRVEKEHLVEEIKRVLRNEVESVRTKFVKENGVRNRNLLTGLKGTAQADDFREKVFEFVVSKEFKGLYRAFTQGHKDCAEKMNDLQIRKATHFYYESIKQEKENLGLIIKIQVVALEREMTKKKIDSEEQQTVQQILGTLREGYQYLGKEIEELVDSFKDAEIKGQIVQTVSESEFQIYMNGIEKRFVFESKESDYEGLLIESLKALGEFGGLFGQIVEDSIMSTVKRYTTTKSLYEYKKMIMEKHVLTDELVRCFKQIVDYFEICNEELKLSENYDIFSGINETMQIKIDTINENRELFISGMEKLLMQAASEKVEISAEDKQLIIEKMLAKWNEIMLNVNLPLDERFFMLLADKILGQIDSLEEIVKFKEKMGRNSEIANGAIEKKVQQYLKNQLLFEVSTFEEIINYSVTRLRESTVDAVKDYVREVDNVTRELVGILKKYSIEQILPVVGDVFNGKEHEVMMAEKSDVYKKGQIIKVMNSGYRVDDLVLIRANVIAAR